jgi:hypothetical protein
MYSRNQTFLCFPFKWEGILNFELFYLNAILGVQNEGQNLEDISNAIPQFKMLKYVVLCGGIKHRDSCRFHHFISFTQKNLGKLKYS